MKVLVKLDYYIGKLLFGAAIFCIVTLLALLMVNLILREMRTATVMDWYAEAVEFLFGWMVLLMASVLGRNKEHFRVNLLEIKYSHRRWYHILRFVINLLGVAFFICFFCFSFKLTYEAEWTMSALPLSRRWAYSSMPVNAFFLSMYALRDTIQSLSAALRAGPLKRC